jgi:beta-1,4-mannooligosaccharide/beta-1,4-mannosyl-N-acetylglucosamine phosphorylase
MTAQSVMIPWQDRPEGCNDIMWRFSENPIIDRYAIPTSNSIFNSAVIPLKMGSQEYSVVIIKPCR